MMLKFISEFNNSPWNIFQHLTIYFLTGKVFNPFLFYKPKIALHNSNMF